MEKKIVRKREMSPKRTHARSKVLFKQNISTEQTESTKKEDLDVIVSKPKKNKKNKINEENNEIIVEDNGQE